MSDGYFCWFIVLFWVEFLRLKNERVKLLASIISKLN